METLSPSLSLPALPLFFSLFIAVYLFGFFFIRWDGVSKPEASSCLISLSHGTPTAVLAAYSILRGRLPLNFDSPNTPFQNTVLEYSIAYFFADLIHYIIFLPNDCLFIAHHVATLYVFLTCRYVVQHGASALLVLLVLAEVTSVCQNTWSLARLRREAGTSSSPAADRSYELLCPLFYSFYSGVRGILGPAFVYKMGEFYWSGGADGVIPVWAWVSWMAVIVGAILASISWVWNLWKELFRERRKKTGSSDQDHEFKKE